MQWYEIARAHRDGQADAVVDEFAFAGPSSGHMSGEAVAVDFASVALASCRHSQRSLEHDVALATEPDDREAVHAAEIEAARLEGIEQGRREAEEVAAEERDALSAEFDARLEELG